MHLRTHALKRKSSRSPTKTAGFYADSIKPKSTNTSPAGKRARSSKSRRVHSPPPKPSSALIHQPAAAAAATRPLQLRVTLGRNSRARSTAPRETSAAATTEEKQLEVAAASSSSSSSSAPESASKRSDADRPLFRSEAVKMAKWHMTPWDYKDAKHRQVYGHPDDVKTAMCEYRIKLVERLGIQEGDRVLEIGCGHGYTTLALAEAVGAEGFVMATDTADENYGSPLTLEQNQTYLLARAPQHLVDRFEFLNQTTVSELFTDYPEYDGYFNKIVFAHSLFYFASTSEIRQTFRLLWDKAAPNAELCIAEWGMVESRKAAAAHRAAVNTQATLEGYRRILGQPCINNVRTAATPNVLKELAQMEGWSNPDAKSKSAEGRPIEGYFAPRSEVPEAKWEVGMVCSQRFDQDVKRVCMALPEPFDAAEAYYQVSTQWEQMQMAIDDHGSEDLEGVLPMDVWHARLPRQPTRLQPTPNDFMRHISGRSRK